MTRTLPPPCDAAAVRARVAELAPDPLPEPASRPADRTWLAAHAQSELGVLHRLIREGLAANPFAHYATEVGELAAETRFRGVGPASGGLTVWSTGAVEALIDGAVGARLDEGAAPDAALELAVPPGVPVELVVRARPGEPPAVALVGADPRSLGAWRAVDPDGRETEVVPRVSDARPPHLVGEPTVDLAVPAGDGVRTLPAPVLGRVSGDGHPPAVLRTGESREEAASDAAPETSHEVRATAGGWETVHELGFAHLRVEPDAAGIRVAARRRPLAGRGAFACSDPTLTRIWATSAATLRATAQSILLDGIKRDRLPWAGDVAVATAAVAHATGDAALVRDTLTALGRPTRGYVNGIADYSLWWVIGTRMHLRHFGDLDHVRREAGHVVGFVDALAAHVDGDGLFDPPSVASGFPAPNPGSVFLDWGVELGPGERSVALQVLWVWALRSAGELLAAVEHDDAPRLAAAADRALAALRRRGRGADDRWSAHLDRSDAAGRHAAFLAVLAGIDSPGEHDPRVTDLEAIGGTPFMVAFALHAAGRAGHPEAAVAELRRRWDAMLEQGAATFWEEFPVPGESTYAMYGRPFGRSLAHAWSAGPASLLPELVLGLRPLDDGWRTVEVAPRLGDLEWAASVVPAPAGDVTVVATPTELRLDLPAGVTAVVGGERIAGPGARVLPATR